MKLPRFTPDRRLLWLLGSAALMVAGELALRGWEAHQQLTSELKSVRSRAQLLRDSADQVDWNAQTRTLQAIREDLLGKLWHAPSEAQAQARLRDWVGETLRSAGLSRFTVNLLPPQAVANGASAPAGSPQNALRVRATVTFELSPGSLEQALQGLERGGQLANIDNITASRRSRRVELALSVPVVIDGTALPNLAASTPRP